MGSHGENSTASLRGVVLTLIRQHSLFSQDSQSTVVGGSPRGYSIPPSPLGSIGCNGCCLIEPCARRDTRLGVTQRGHLPPWDVRCARRQCQASVQRRACL